MSRLLSYLCPLALVAAAFAGLDQVKLQIAGEEITLEVADTIPERTRGLSLRESLEPQSGMLFSYAKAAPACFWMRDTYIPLDAAFITAGGRVAKVATMTPESLDRHCSGVSVQWVIEMPAGWFFERGITRGSRLDRKTLEKLRAVTASSAI